MSRRTSVIESNKNHLFLSGPRFGSITHGTPRDLTLSDKHRNPIYPAQDPLLMKKFEEEAKWQERQRQLHLVEKEREQQMLHHQVMPISLPFIS